MIPDLLALASLPGMNQHLLVALCSKAYSTPLICCKLDSQALKSKQILKGVDGNGMKEGEHGVIM